ncbi:MAG: M12 family metallo-peptidase [Bacteroidales bacterium]|jgi:hypothetical protein|nr:M12 family metallo-peptidase [Bacteroidales bacterium]
MKKVLILLSVFYLVGFSLFGQGNMLYSEVQQAKESNVYFENAVLPKVSPNAEALKNFTNPDEVSFLGNISLDLKNNDIKAMNLLMSLKNKDMILELVEVPEYFYDYVVTTSDGAHFSANRDIKHYRGIVKNEINTLVAITFYEDEIMGLIYTDEGNFNIVKDRQSNKHLFYNDKNIKEKLPFICETTDDFSSYDPEVLFGQRSADGSNKKVRFYVETEYDIFQTRGSVASVETFISGLFHQVAILYQNENITTGISELYIWTSEDPYTGTNTDVLLNQFKSKTTSIDGDLGILLTFRNIGGGQAAGFNGLCNYSTAESLSVAMLDNRYSIVPVYSWSVMVVTHELGHLFGSRHTHACVWNGDDTAIDGCAGYVEGYCSLPGSPPEGGTMMSYCHNTSVGINFNLGFGPQPGNVIRNNVINASCLLYINLEIMEIKIANATGEIKPGETSDIHIYLTNTGDDFASNLTAILTSSSPYLIINKDTAYYGQLYPEQYKYRPYNITLSPDAPTGTTEAPITLTVTEKTGRTTGLDAILQFKNVGEPPQACNSIEELSAEVIDSDIKLAWDTPSAGTPEKYLVYCNDLFLKETTEVTYTHTNVKLGIYHYCIEVLYEDGCTGEPVCIEAITPCNVPIDLKIKIFTNAYRLTWTPTVENVYYKVYRNSEFLAEVEGNAYNDLDIEPDTRYCYTVIAVCPDDTESEISNEVCEGGVGIEELQNDIKIYPNPTSGELTVETDNYPSVQGIEILDMMGQMHESAKARKHGREILMDISDLPT